MQNGHPHFLFATGEGESRASGLAVENGVEAVIRLSPVQVQAHPAEELLQAAVCVHCCGEAAGLGSGSGGAAERFQGRSLCGARVDGDGR